jgi:hypothetical protein
MTIIHFPQRLAAEGKIQECAALYLLALPCVLEEEEH